MRINGVPGTTASASDNFGINQFWLGASPHIWPTDFWAGTISEVILYPSTISGNQLTLLERDQRSYHGTP